MTAVGFIISIDWSVSALSSECVQRFSVKEPYDTVNSKPTSKTSLQYIFRYINKGKADRLVVTVLEYKIEDPRFDSL